MNPIQNEINTIDKFLGFSTNKLEIDPNSKWNQNDLFSYGVCQRFYKKHDELKTAINITTKILLNLINLSDEKHNKQLSDLFSLLGNMHYVAGDYEKSIGCFMKALSYNKNDLTSWIEFMFSLRSNGNFDIFEDLMFNIEEIYNAWKFDSESQLSKEKVYELINKVKN